MTDQMIPADKVRAILAKRDLWAIDRITEIEAILPPPPLPTLADMTEEERASCKWMQADVDGEITSGIIAKINPTDAHLLDGDGETWFLAFDTVTPRPDLPRLEWPGDTPTPPPATPTEGSEWDDIDALTQACDKSGRDQITVIDCDGDVFVWGAVAGWWETGTPSDGYEPYTIIHAGKEADQ